MSWNGKLVASLGVKVSDDRDSLFSLKELVGLALRKNPKRAHLLVSNVLGKHIPTNPQTVLGAGRLLGVLVREELTGEKTAQVDILADILRLVKNGDNSRKDLRTKLEMLVKPTDTVVMGYAETATALGASVALQLAAPYIHSTRYPSSDKDYIAFEESHSHATTHHLTADPAFFAQSESVVLVDDEFSTGATALNTIRALHARYPHSKYVVAALIDLRSDEAKESFTQTALELQTEISVVSLASGKIRLPESLALDAVDRLTKKFNERAADVPETYTPLRVSQHGYAPVKRQMKDGVENESDYIQTAIRIALSEPDNSDRKLVLGVEEDMFLPLLVAGEMQGENVYFSTTTLSPVFPFEHDGYAIRDAITYFVPEEKTPRHAYNIGYHWDEIILVLSSMEETHQLSGLIDALEGRTKKVKIYEPVDLPAPLTAPAFGSYAESDVKWLLKDLSDVQLEAPTEEREEAIQQGQAHYSESLPIEYQPSVDYQDLFKVSLEETSHRLAVAVAVVGEQIRSARRSPVLVSLARAGVPIGVLIKRYLEKNYHHAVPHYAVSIVRGRGIDYNALRYIALHHNPEDIMFVDGWTGKGAIVKELVEAVRRFQMDTGISIPEDLAVLADPGHCVDIYGTRDDYLIPSACLNSTVSGLISRTVLRDDLIREKDYHGAKFYREFQDIDFSNYFIDKVTAEFDNLSEADIKAALNLKENAYASPDFSGWADVEEISEQYEINNVNLVKPGVGETTRVLLRRVPWRILMRPDRAADLTHVKLLAESRGVDIEYVENLTYSCVGLIHPKYTKGATGFDGGKV